jgi:hypothetical protein
MTLQHSTTPQTFAFATRGMPFRHVSILSKHGRHAILYKENPTTIHGLILIGDPL